METIEIPKYQAKIIANALRLTANIHGCGTKKRETIDDGYGFKISAESAWDREVIKAEQFINDVLK